MSARRRLRSAMAALALVAAACSSTGAPTGSSALSTTPEITGVASSAPGASPQTSLPPEDVSTPTPQPSTAPSTSIRPGPVLSGHNFGFAVSSSSLDDPTDASILVADANMITVENEMKMDRIHPARGVYEFDTADRIVEFAQANGQQVRGHTLIWHNQLPEFVTGTTWDREGLIDVLRSHIRRIVKHYADKYPGVVTQWDVVNEAFNADGSRRPSIWQEVIGDDYIDLAFQFARDADPDALLFYNDYFGAGILGNDDPSLAALGASSERSDCDDVPKCVATRALAAQLVADGVPIDGIGFEGHIFDLDSPDYARLADWTAPLGLQWALTEIDVGLPADRVDDAALVQRQADIFVGMVRDCVESPNCNTTVVWGVTDGRSWVPDATSGRLDRPLLYRADGAAKPVAELLQELIAKASD